MLTRSPAEGTNIYMSIHTYINLYLHIYIYSYIHIHIQIYIGVDPGLTEDRLKGIGPSSSISPVKSRLVSVFISPRAVQG